MNPVRLILASASPRRAELLRQLTTDFEVIASQAPESEDPSLSPSELAQLNAYRKARAVARQYPGALVLGADTVVALGTKLFGKPASRADAVRMLQTLSGQTHAVVTGVCLMRAEGGWERLFADVTRVRFRELSLELIEEYLATIDPLDKAGGYAIQEGGEKIALEVSGSYTNVIGLPIERLKDELQRMR